MISKPISKEDINICSVLETGTFIQNYIKNISWVSFNWMRKSSIIVKLFNHSPNLTIQDENHNFDYLYIHIVLKPKSSIIMNQVFHFQTE